MTDTPSLRDQAIDHAVAACDAKSTARHAAHVASDLWENEVDRLIQENQRLQRRCEIYGAALTAIAFPLPGSNYGTLAWTAKSALDRLNQLD